MIRFVLRKLQQSRLVGFDLKGELASLFHDRHGCLFLGVQGVSAYTLMTQVRELIEQLLGPGYFTIGAFFFVAHGDHRAGHAGLGIDQGKDPGRVADHLPVEGQMAGQLALLVPAIFCNVVFESRFSLALTLVYVALLAIFHRKEITELQLLRSERWSRER